MRALHPKPNYFSSHHGSCDCCGKTKPLTFMTMSCVDTYACAECRGGEPDEEEIDFHELFGEALT